MVGRAGIRLPAGAAPSKLAHDLRSRCDGVAAREYTSPNDSHGGKDSHGRDDSQERADGRPLLHPEVFDDYT